MKLINAKIEDFKLKDRNIKVIKLGEFRSNKYPNNFCKLVAVNEKILKLVEEGKSLEDDIEVKMNKGNSGHYGITLSDKKDNGSLLVLHDVVKITLPDISKGKFFFKLSGTRRDGEARDYLIQIKPSDTEYSIEVEYGSGQICILGITKYGGCFVKRC